MRRGRPFRMSNIHSGHNRVRLHTACLLVCVLAAAGRAQSPGELFASGNTAYRDGKFKEAAAAYEAILRNGLASAEVYYNLGNVYYRQGMVGKSILAFERAAARDPGNDDIVFNLQLARLRTVDRIESVPEVFLLSWLRSITTIMPLASTRNLFLIFWGITFVSLAIVFVVRSSVVLRYGRASFLAGMLFALLFGALFGAQAALFQEHDMAIVTSSTVTVKSSPDPGSVDAFVVHEGLKVRMSDGVADWAKITLADGKVGWVKKSDVERV